MSTRFNISPYTVIPNQYGSPVNGNSMAANITSSPTIVSKLSMISYSCVWTGSSPVGTISIQASDDYSFNAEGQVNNPGTWNTMPFSYWNGSSVATVTSVPVTGNSGNGIIDIAPTGIYAIRLVYTATSGTGNLTVTVTAKDS